MTHIRPERAAEPHPEVQGFLQLYESMDVPELHELTPETARTTFDQQLTMLEVDVEIDSVQDGRIEGPAGDVPYRLYDPREEPAAETPVILYLHGGGWVVGNIETHDGNSRTMATLTGYPVVSIDYRLAPEHPFPAALKDTYAALEWVHRTAADIGVDPERLVVAGTSAGGNLAAAVSLFSRDHDGPDVAQQVLIYPATGDAQETKSYEQNAEDYFLTVDTMEWFSDCYLPDDVDRGNVYAMPRRAHDLSDLPPATVITAGFDPLRDDGAKYAQRLADDGVPVDYRNYEDMIHGFVNMIGGPIDLDAAHEAYEYVSETLERNLE